MTDRENGRQVGGGGFWLRLGSMTLIALLVFAIAAAVIYYWTASSKAPSVPPDPFADIALSRGISRPNVCGSDGLIYIFENIGSGAALFDYDGDGRLDVFINNAGTTSTIEGPPKRVRLVPGPGTSLYRQLADGNFLDVTESAGVSSRVWGTGVAVGDVDNDGDLDLFAGAFGVNRLYVNRGDGTFVERSGAAGLAGSSYTSSAAFLDYDRDGDLDLYVVNYVLFDLDNPPNDGEPCLTREVVISCPPTMHPPMPDVLYRNRGDGTFEDVTGAAGMGNQPGAYGLGVAVGDLNRDGWPDIYVANDTQANFLWQNQGDGTFEETGLFSGVALDESGQGQSGMGVDIGDVDGDGWLDIQVNNFSEEACAYYRNLGDGTFVDDTARSGLRQATFMFLGWGSKFFDYDHDGDLDLISVNGHVQARADELGPGLSFEQKIQLFRKEEGRFEDVSGDYGAALTERRNHRGLAAGDIDGDGDVDLLITLLDGPPLLLQNNVPGRRGSIGFRLKGSDSNSEGIGSRIELSSGGKIQVREVSRAGSYLSANEGLAHFGVGDHERVDAVTVRWSSGKVTQLRDLKTRRLYLLHESNDKLEVVRVFPEAFDRS